MPAPSRRASAGLRQQAHRDRLDGGARLIVFVLVLINARTLWEVNVPPPQPVLGNNALFVTVVGRQWWWEYTYESYNGKPIRALGPDGKETDLPVVTANELLYPGERTRARPVRFT